MEINAREARSKISALLDKALRGEEVIILRRGKKVARIVPVEGLKKELPDLTLFRESIAAKGRSLSQTVREERSEERY